MLVRGQDSEFLGTLRRIDTIGIGKGILYNFLRGNAERYPASDRFLFPANVERRNRLKIHILSKVSKNNKTRSITHRRFHVQKVKRVGLVNAFLYLFRRDAREATSK